MESHPFVRRTGVVEKCSKTISAAFYLPLYKMEKARGSVSAWDYVKDDPKLPRVLLIATPSLAATPSPFARHSPVRSTSTARPKLRADGQRPERKLDIWLSDGKWDLIHFNFGIHDRATKRPTTKQRLETIIARLQKTGAKLIWGPAATAVARRKQ